MSKRPPDLYDDVGTHITLGSMIGQGGEGAVWDIPSQPQIVAKVYHQRLSPERIAKIRAMTQMSTTALQKLTAWPTGLLNQAGVGPVGLLLPKVSGSKDIHQLYGPKSRRAEFLRADWRFLVRTAANTSRAFAAVHQSGCVIGDVNHGSILVAQDATVRLIDCDSFQVFSNGHQYFCEVGVETFTPPELQGKAFKGVVRTANHDNFGLAVLVFLLAFMGRHPFAGRYSGQGDMTIPQAIEQVRFPYGAQHAQVQMDRPPGTPPLPIVGPQISALLERAFSRTTTVSGRPSAKEWVEGLDRLEKELVQCKANPAHWHHVSTNCPWCPMEGALGLPLFGLVFEGSGSTPTFDMSAFWILVESVRSPGRAPPIEAKPAEASEWAQAAVRKQKIQYGAAAMATILLVILSKVAEEPRVLIGAFATAMAILLMKDAKNKTESARRQKATKAQWAIANEEWLKKAGDQSFVAKKAQLADLRREWEGLSMRKAALLQSLKNNQRQVQLDRYLDQFEISSAKIENIGPGRKQTLESFNVETALDVTPRNLQNVPGFGPKLQQKLFAWRRALESSFFYDPAKGPDPRDIQKIDTNIRATKVSLEERLNRGLAELRQASAQINASRQHMRARVEQALTEMVQAEADYKALY
jgi:DNA-binding helix-hairpin-helix protein with protein kinase domain